jgi:uncharacterized protein with von Willebrand factor type A (vWA) domain
MKPDVSGLMSTFDADIFVIGQLAEQRFSRERKAFSFSNLLSDKNENSVIFS